MIKEQHNNVPFSPAKSPVFYGWFIVLWGTLGIIMSVPGQTMGVSTFTDHLIDALRLDRNELSTAYLLGTIASSFLLTRAGKLYDKIGARWLGTISGFAMSSLVFFSAMGPLLFSFSFTELGSYAWAAYLCLAIVAINFIAAFKADNPQEKLARS
jgi:hypothetical protein